MRFTEKLNKNWGIIENVIFFFAFGFIMYSQIASYWKYIYDSAKGKGYLGAIVDPILTRNYYISVVSIIIILNTTCLLWEIFSFIIRLFKQERGTAQGYNKFKHIFKVVSINYKPSFLALLIYELLPKLFLIHMFWIWLPYIQKIQLFTINLSWYSWVYALICWELATWVFHFSCHRVRIFWTLHSPHHAPSELNMAVNWIHFFAESYYSTFVHLVISLILGVNPVMFLAIMSIESAWGIFVHVSEGTLKNGKLGILQYLIITPAHHRVHHAKTPLYIDTNFASIVPIWDWMFGTLQPFKEEVKLEYGITRDLDVTNFLDLYFGEILVLYRDIKNAEGIKNKLLYIIMPPGWTPANTVNTASVMRRDFLKTNPELGLTSRDRILAALKFRSKTDKLKLKGVEIHDK